MYRTSNGAYTNSVSLALDQPFTPHNDTIEGLYIKDRKYLINRPLVKGKKIKKQY